MILHLETIIRIYLYICQTKIKHIHKTPPCDGTHIFITALVTPELRWWDTKKTKQVVSDCKSSVNTKRKYLLRLSFVFSVSYQRRYPGVNMVSMETPAVTPFTNQAHRNHANPGVTHSVTPRILSKVDRLYFSDALHSRSTLKDKTNLTSAYS
jgi:hypothetical protein